MPASRFFLMLEQIDRLKGKELADACFVSRSAQMTVEAFGETVSYFENFGEKKERPKDVEVQKRPSLKAGSVQAKDAVFGLFSDDNRINRRVQMTPTENPHPRWRN